MLTEEERKAIERDALGYNCSPYGNPNPVTYGYVKGATAERIKAKKLIKALEEIKSELGGEPSEENAAEAFSIATEAINEYNKTK